ncbi:MAG: beta-glucuronidase [Clostridiales bacterium]|nr:beta-glucuronidase [Clostridiales bacterium]
MIRQIRLDDKRPFVLRTIDERLVSYNIEMTEVTGGTFWKKYTPDQIDGTEDFRISGISSDFTKMADLMQYYPPINLYDEKLRRYAKWLGPTWIRVSGSWATKTYYDFEGTTGGVAPQGYASVLTKAQWIGVLEFVKAVGGKLLVSVSNCAGDHPNGEGLDLTQTKKLFHFSHAYGVDIDAAEFMNEPNMLEMSGAPLGYTSEDYARDQDIFFGWVKENYPRCLCVGPCTLGDGAMGRMDVKSAGAGIGSMMQMVSTDDLLRNSVIPMDVFSYHYYNGVSERLAAVMPEGHWDASEAHTDAYLTVALDNARVYAPLRDRYVPGGQMWVTESGDAGGGGNTWASTYLDVLRTLNELGGFAEITDGIIFHNTLASSDYGFLSHENYEPRPNYFAVLLWNHLMGSTVYKCNVSRMENMHIYCHSRKDGKDGCAYLIINNSKDQSLKASFDGKAECYCLHADTLRSSQMKLNGAALTGDESVIGRITKGEMRESSILLPPCSCTFMLL